MRLVLDASAALRVSDATQPGHAEAVAALTDAFAAGAEAFAPDLYPYEIGNALRKSRARGEERTRVFFDTLALAEVVRPSADAMARALDAGDDEKLSYHDAAYVALAEELDALVWTEDKELLKRFRARTADTAELARRLRP